MNEINNRKIYGIRELGDFKVLGKIQNVMVCC
jgi:hypothetical protein